MSSVSATHVLIAARLAHEATIEVRDKHVHAARPGLADDHADGTLLPGFVELQCNGAAGHTLRDANATAFDAVARALLRAGTTTWCPTLPTAPEAAYRPFVEAAARAGDRPGPRMAGVHLEGPFLNPARKGAHAQELLRTPDPQWLADLLGEFPGLVRIVTLAPELPGALELIDVCRERGVVVSLGHTDATADEAAAAFDRGARMVTHLFNAMRPIHHREPGVIIEAVGRRDIFCGMICDGIHVERRVAAMFASFLGPERCFVVSDAVASPSPGPVLSGGFALQDGALSNLLEWGVTMRDAGRMLASTPAAAAGLHDRGELLPGRIADFVQWRAGRVERVWLDGKPVDLRQDQVPA